MTTNHGALSWELAAELQAEHPAAGAKKPGRGAEPPP